MALNQETIEYAKKEAKITFWGLLTSLYGCAPVFCAKMETAGFVWGNCDWYFIPVSKCGVIAMR